MGNVICPESCAKRALEWQPRCCSAGPVEQALVRPRHARIRGKLEKWGGVLKSLEKSLSCQHGSKTGKGQKAFSGKTRNQKQKVQGVFNGTSVIPVDLFGAFLLLFDCYVNSVVLAGRLGYRVKSTTSEVSHIPPA